MSKRNRLYWSITLSCHKLFPFLSHPRFCVLFFFLLSVSCLSLSLHAGIPCLREYLISTRNDGAVHFPPLCASPPSPHVLTLLLPPSRVREKDCFFVHLCPQYIHTCNIVYCSLVIQWLWPFKSWKKKN